VGRKRVLVAGVGLFGAGAFWFYGASGAALPAAWVLMMGGSFAAGVLFSALGGELFPTSHRSTASAARTIMVAAGAALGLWTEGLLFDLLGSHAAAIRWILAALVVPPLVVSLFIPETARRELEEISPERNERMAGGTQP
jgi:MFS family permease